MKDKNEETKIITVEEYEELVEAHCFLSALEAAGVNNWDGYDVAKNIMSEWNECNE